MDKTILHCGLYGNTNSMEDVCLCLVFTTNSIYQTLKQSCVVVNLDFLFPFIKQKYYHFKCVIKDINKDQWKENVS